MLVVDNGAVECVQPDGLEGGGEGVEVGFGAAGGGADLCYDAVCAGEAGLAGDEVVVLVGVVGVEDDVDEEGGGFLWDGLAWVKLDREGLWDVVGMGLCVVLCGFVVDDLDWVGFGKRAMAGHTKVVL